MIVGMCHTQMDINGDQFPQTLLDAQGHHLEDLILVKTVVNNGSIVFPYLCKTNVMEDKCAVLN